VSLLVDLPAGYQRERAYVLDVVLGDMLGLPYAVRVTGRRDVRIRLAGEDRHCEVLLPDVLFATEREAWLTAATLPAEPLRWVEARMLGVAGERRDRLPVVYGEPSAGEPVQRSGGRVRVAVDVLGSAFFMLTRYEEVVRVERDEHERFPARAALAARSAFLERPIVDEYADLLWAALSECWPRLRRRQTTYKVHLTHDVDHPFATLGVGPGTVVRQSAGDVVRRRDVRLAGRRLRSYAAARRGVLSFDPFNTHGFLMDVSERHGLRSSFYFLAGSDGGAYAAAYRLDDAPIARLLAAVYARGHEVGLHGSYAALRDATRLRREFQGLRAAAKRLGIEQERWGGRQHYLRWESPITWTGWELAGLDYDASAGFAQLPGFRTGTCREHAVFDVVGGRPLALRERPLHVMMDSTLLDYMRLSHSEAAEVVVSLARRCRAHAGELFLLCHNSSLARARDREWYRSIVAAIAG
jgi:hypothetical protein